MWPHQCWGEGKDHLPWSVGNTPNAVQGNIHQLFHQSTLLARVWLGVSEDPQRPFLQSCFAACQPSACTPYTWGYSSPNVGLLHFEIHEAPVPLFRQPVKAHLGVSTILWCISCFSLSCIISKPTVDTLPHYQGHYLDPVLPLEYTINNWPPATLHVTEHHPLRPAIQTVFNPLHSRLIQPILLQLLCKDLRDTNKVDNIHCSPTIYQASCLIWWS